MAAVKLVLERVVVPNKITLLLGFVYCELVSAVYDGVEGMKRYILRFIADILERMCFLTHWLNPLLIRLRLPHCLPTLWSYRLDRRYNLGIWHQIGETK